MKREAPANGIHVMEGFDAAMANIRQARLAFEATRLQAEALGMADLAFKCEARCNIIDRLILNRKKSE